MKIKNLEKKYFSRKNIIILHCCFAMLIIFSVSCKVKKTPTQNIITVNKSNANNKQIRELPKLQKIKQNKLIEKYYDSGNKSSNNGEVLKAESQFNLTVLAILNQNNKVKQIEENNNVYKEILENIFSAESQWYDFDVYDNELGSETSNILINGDAANISIEEAEKEKKIVEKTATIYNIPVVFNKRVLSMVKAYSTNLKPIIKKTLERSGQYVDRFKEIFREEGVPDDLAYLPIIESGYRTHALSRAKAKGIWQFMKGTARLEGLKVNWWVDERCDPEMATRAAAKHLKRLYGMFDDWYLALAAYNAGPGKVNWAIRKAKTRDYWKIINKRWVFRRETKNYVSAYLAALIIAKNTEKYGFKDLNYSKKVKFDTVYLDSCTDLAVVAKLTNSKLSELQKLNPHLMRLITPPNDRKFKLNIPFETKGKFIAEFNELPVSKRVTIRYHKIKEGQTLSQIARKYKTSVSAIKRANRIKGTMIRAGKTIVIPIGQGKNIYFPKSYQAKKVKLRYKTGKKITVKIRRRDTLFGLAIKYRTDTKSLKKWNNLESDFLKPGQKLTLYYNKSVVKKELKKKIKKKIPEGYHLVKRGDSLYSIAKAYSIDVKEIRILNKKSSNIIRPGELIKVCN